MAPVFSVPSLCPHSMEGKSHGDSSISRPGLCRVCGRAPFPCVEMRCDRPK